LAFTLLATQGMSFQYTQMGDEKILNISDASSKVFAVLAVK